MNEFEKYPELVRQIKSYETCGKFENYYTFKDVLNDALKQSNKYISSVNINHNKLEIDKITEVRTTIYKNECRFR